MKRRMEWRNIFTENSLALLASRRNTNLLAFFFSIFLIGGCATHRQEPQAGVPEGPTASGGATDASLNSLVQGLNYVREHPSTREDEKIQRFLWLDQWLKVLQEKNRLTPEMAQEFWADLVSFVKDPPAVGLPGLDRILSGAQTKLGKNIANYYSYQTLLKDQSLEAALKKLEFVEEDNISDLYVKSNGLLQLFRNKATSDSRKIGVLLPLSGDLRPLAEEVMQAIQVAGNLAYSNGIEFVIEDVGTNEQDLLKAWDKLAVKEKVSVVIGPLTSKDSEMIFERAEILSIPVISLAPKEGLEGFGNFGFRSVLTLEDQVRKAAKHMAGDLKAKRVAVLMPDLPYGWDAMAVAKKAFADEGLEIAQMQVYKPGATDFKDQLRRMTRLDIPRLRKDELCPKDSKQAKEPKEEKKPAEDGKLPEDATPLQACVKKLPDLKPIIDFEVLFVPDSAETVGLLLPTLPYLRIYGVQVVGLSQYNSPKLVERAGEHAEGVIFTDGYLPGSTDFQTRFFRDQYLKLAQKEPSRLAAEAFDIAMMLAKILHESQAVLPRDLLVERLKSVKDFPGVTGSIYYENHKFKKEPRMLVMRNGVAQELRLKD